MRLYHRTSTASAEAILRDGFGDGRGTYLTAAEHTGVWLADQPLDENEGARGNVVLCIEVPARVVKPYEWIEEGKGFREFLAPAELLNRYTPAQVREVDLPRDWAVKGSGDRVAAGIKWKRREVGRLRGLNQP